MAEKFRKKPVVIEAMQWDGSLSRADEIIAWAGGDVGPIGCSADGDRAYDPFINTLEGEMTISDGDWIIRGIAGEFYPCKPDIFEATYEAVS